MSRNDGIDRCVARNRNLNTASVSDAQKHNERENEIYANPDIVPERTALNIHFKIPISSYEDMFAQMEAEKIISTRGLKPDAIHFGELIFDVNSAYFYNHGGYEYARNALKPSLKKYGTAFLKYRKHRPKPSSLYAVFSIPCRNASQPLIESKT